MPEDDAIVGFVFRTVPGTTTTAQCARNSNVMRSGTPTPAACVEFSRYAPGFPDKARGGGDWLTAGRVPADRISIIESAAEGRGNLTLEWPAH